MKDHICCSDRLHSIVSRVKKIKSMVSSIFAINCGCWYFEFILKLTLFMLIRYKIDAKMSKPPSKRRRVELTLQDKINLIKESASFPKPSQKSLSEKFGVGNTTQFPIF